MITPKANTKKRKKQKHNDTDTASGRWRDASESKSGKNFGFFLNCYVDTLFPRGCYAHGDIYS